MVFEQKEEGFFVLTPKSLEQFNSPTETELLKAKNAELQKTAAQMSADFQALTDILVQQGVI